MFSLPVLLALDGAWHIVGEVGGAASFQRHFGGSTPGTAGSPQTLPWPSAAGGDGPDISSGSGGPGAAGGPAPGAAGGSAPDAAGGYGRDASSGPACPCTAHRGRGGGGGCAPGAAGGCAPGAAGRTLTAHADAAVRERRDTLPPSAATQDNTDFQATREAVDEANRRGSSGTARPGTAGSGGGGGGTPWPKYDQRLEMQKSNRRLDAMDQAIKKLSLGHDDIDSKCDAIRSRVDVCKTIAQRCHDDGKEVNKRLDHVRDDLMHAVEVVASALFENYQTHFDRRVTETTNFMQNKMDEMVTCIDVLRTGVEEQQRIVRKQFSQCQLTMTKLEAVGEQTTSSLAEAHATLIDVKARQAHQDAKTRKCTEGLNKLQTFGSAAGPCPPGLWTALPRGRSPVESRGGSQRDARSQSGSHSREPTGQRLKFLQVEDAQLQAMRRKAKEDGAAQTVPQIVAMQGRPGHVVFPPSAREDPEGHRAWWAAVPHTGMGEPGDFTQME
jgi:hypothetical protein